MDRYCSQLGIGSASDYQSAGALVGREIQVIEYVNHCDLYERELSQESKHKTA